MPREIVKTTAEGGSYVSPSSRYFLAPLIFYEDRLTYPIYRKKELSFNPTDQHYEITREFEYRPDLVSMNFFGAPDFWWKIMEMNGMKDILEFKAGRNIILPGGSLMF